MKSNICLYCAGHLVRNLAVEHEFMCQGCYATFDIDDLPRRKE